MRVVVDIDGRYDRTPDGAVWATGGGGYQYWSRLLEVFDNVALVGRLRNVVSVPEDWKRLNGPNVSFEGMPYYLGPWQYLRSARDVNKAASNLIHTGDAVILSNGLISLSMESVLRRMDYPYAVRVVGDPYDVFSPGSIKHPMRPLFRWWFPHELRRMCAGAFAAVYVTKEALQRRYPCPGYSLGVSDVDLSDDAFVPKPRAVKSGLSTVEVLMVGTLAQLYKAPNVLIDAVAACVRDGVDLRLTFVGDGKHRPALESQAAAQGIGEKVIFRGILQAPEVREAMDHADLFVLPSFQEGLPRAMVEAMARAMPCIGSTVGGIPELLSREDMVPPGSAVALARKIREVVSSPKRMAAMSTRNLETARNYRESVLRDQWTGFYRYVREGTQEWLKSSNR
ncbi:MAG: glycosyltransferase family 4 protein [Armatimonadota bacterium]|nr:glycosyltransferase family 4 protein [bacterium]